MGMYTDLVMGVSLRKDTPREIIVLLEQMLSGDGATPPASVADHPLFKTDRWYWMLCSGGSLHDDDGKPSLNVRINIKNYGREIERFCDFIAPYTHIDEELAGYKQHECSILPTLLYFRDGKAKWHEVECPTLAEIE